MKKIVYVGLMILVPILALSISVGFIYKARYTKANQVEETFIKKEELNRSQKAWLWALVWCESRGNEKAINPKDLDNTPSYGLLQFKPSTFIAFKKQYGVEGELMDPDAQEAIVKKMIINGRKDWSRQFPDCVKKLGNPPFMHNVSVDKK